MIATTTRAGLILGLLALLTAACRPALRPPPAPTAALVRLEAPPPLVDDGNRQDLVEAVRASLAYYARLPPDRTVAFGGERARVAEMTTALEALATLLPSDPPADALAAEIRRRFVVYRAAAPAGVLFTGYYLPVVQARAQREDGFRFPILGRPPDLVTVALDDFACDCAATTQLLGRVDDGRLVPYYTRAEITSAPGPSTPVLAWVDDPVALFFLQIQGAGILALPDGIRRRVGFAASNGRPYVSIGKLLIDEGRLTPDQASMQGIQRWAAEHPEERERVLNANPRYIFLRPLDGPPVGSLGVPVTAGRTIATDPLVYPPGALAFIRIPTEPPAGTGTASATPGTGITVPPLARFVLNQDAGAAIRGPERADVFFGEGDEAEATAGRLKARGELYFLAPRAIDLMPQSDAVVRRALSD
jgi:membrane-bound lytic murein transglycosylase A